jgi:hypothetical protein
MPFPEVRKEQAIPEIVEEEKESFDYWSCPESLPEEVILRRHESAILLCDNYEKH